MYTLIIPSWYPDRFNEISGSFFKEQAEALAKTGNKVIVIYPRLISIPNIGKFEWGLEKYIENGVHTYIYNVCKLIPKSARYEESLFNRKLKYLYDYVVKEHGIPDIIHAHSTLWAGVGAKYISSKNSIPYVITEHSSIFSTGVLKGYRVRAVEKALGGASSLIAVSKGLKKDLLKYREDKEINVIPNIVNIDKFNIDKGTESKKEFTFFTLGYLDYKKGIDILIEAFNIAFKDKQVKLRIGGDGPDKNILQDKVKELGIEKQVEFLGSISRDVVPKYMQNCNCFVLPSRFETFGVVFIEAIACGKPIIASKTGGPDSIVTNKNGLLVNVGDCEDLVDKMSIMVEKYDNYNPKDIREDCINRFSEVVIVEELEMLYKSVLSNK